MKKTASSYNSHVGLWRIQKSMEKLEVIGPNPRVEAYVKDQMLEHFERMQDYDY